MRQAFIVRQFEIKFGFPQCVGAIDKTHISPVKFANDYYNRKGYHSVFMQGLVDCKYCFTNILYSGGQKFGNTVDLLLIY